MGTATGNVSYQEITNQTGRVFRVGETPRDILGYGRWVPIMAAWFAMCLAGLLEYTWGALSGSLAPAHHWGPAPTFWLFSFYVIFESFIQPVTGWMRGRGILKPRYAVMIGGTICGIVGYGILNVSGSDIWLAYFGYAFLGGIGSGMVYNTCVNIVGKWFPEKKGWRTGFVNGGWAYGAVPFIFAIGAANSGGGAISMSASSAETFILVQGIIMTVGIVGASLFIKDPPKNWWPKNIDPLEWHKHSTRDLRNNPPALRHYNVREMWNTPQPKWMGFSFACYVGCSLFGVAYYYPFAEAEHLGTVAAVVGFAGFSLTDGIFRPIYGYISEFIGRRRTMAFAYALNVIFQMLAYVCGIEHNAPLFAICAIISGGLSGANFPMTAAMTADYYGETGNAFNYGTVYQWKALGGSFAGGGAALVMTGTLYGTATFHWLQGFIFGSALGAIAAVIVWYRCKPPTVVQMEAAVQKAAEREELRTQRAQRVAA